MLVDIDINIGGVADDFLLISYLKKFISLMPMKDYTYMVINDRKVS